MEVKREGGNEDRAFSEPPERESHQSKESSDGLHQTFPWLLVYIFTDTPFSLLWTSVHGCRQINQFGHLNNLFIQLHTCSLVPLTMNKSPSNWQEMSIKTGHFTFGTLVSHGHRFRILALTNKASMILANLPHDFSKQHIPRSNP